MIRPSRAVVPRVLFDEVEAARIRREVEAELEQEKRFMVAWRRYAQAVRRKREQAA